MQEINKWQQVSQDFSDNIFSLNERIKELESKLASFDYAKEEDRKTWKNGKLSPK